MMANRLGMIWKSSLHGLAVGMLIAVATPVFANEKTCVDDDADKRICVTVPAQRIVSLAPHATDGCE